MTPKEDAMREAVARAIGAAYVKHPTGTGIWDRLADAAIAAYRSVSTPDANTLAELIEAEKRVSSWILSSAGEPAPIEDIMTLTFAADTLTQQESEIEALREALKLALEYWAHRQQRYKNRSPVWVKGARAALSTTTNSGEDA